MTRPASAIRRRSPGRPRRRAGASPSASSRSSAGRSAGRRPTSSSRPSAQPRARVARSRCSALVSVATRRRGRPLWARPRTSPSRRSSKSFSASSKPSVVAATARRRSCSVVPSAAWLTRTQKEASVPAPDPAPQLVELGQAEALRALDDHQRCLRHVHAHLDHGRAHEHVEVAVAEAGHLRVAVRGLEAPVDEPHAQRREQLREPLVLRLGRRGPRRLHVLVGQLVVAGPAAVLLALPRPGRPPARSAARRRTCAAPRRPPRAPGPTCRPAPPGGGSPSGSASGPRAPTGAWTRRGPRRAPGPASAGSASRSSAGRAARPGGPSPRARRAAPRRTGAARRPRRGRGRRTRRSPGSSACVPTTTCAWPRGDGLARLALRRPPGATP